MTNIRMTHTGISGYAVTTQDAFDLVWSGQGWVSIGPDDGSEPPADGPIIPTWLPSMPYSALQMASHPTTGAPMVRITGDTSRSAFDSTESALWLILPISDYGSTMTAKYDTSGLVDDGDNIRARITSAQTWGGPNSTVSLEFPSGVIGFTGDVIWPDGVGWRAAGGGINAAVGTRFIALDATSRMRFQGGGDYEHGTIDGNHVATQPHLRELGSGSTFLDVHVVNSAGNGWTWNKGQNDEILSCQTQGNAGWGLVLDLGCGGLKFDRFENNANGLGSYLIQQTGLSPEVYAVPTHIKFDHCLGERPTADVPIVEVTCASTGIFFDTLVASGWSNAAATSPLVKLSGGAVISFDNCRWFNYGTGAVEQPVFSLSGAGTTAILNGHHSLYTYGVDFDVPSGTRIAGAPSFLLPSGRTSLTFSAASPTNGDSVAYTSALLPRSVIRQATTSWVYECGVAGETGRRRRTYADGSEHWGPGTGFTFDTHLQRGGVGLLQTLGDFNAKRLLRTITTTTMVSSTSLALDASATDRQNVLLNGFNVTATTITGHSFGQEFALSFTTGATAGTVVWPTAFYREGTPPPTSLLPLTRTTVRYSSDGTSLYEEGRTPNASNTVATVPVKTRTGLVEAAQGLKGENFSLVFAVASAIPPSGSIYAEAIGLFGGDVVTNLIVWPTTAPSGLTLVRLALLDLTDKPVALTADIHSTFTAAGALVVPLATPFTAPADGVWRIAQIQVGTAPASLIRGTSGITGFSPTVGGFDYSRLSASQADFPAIGTAVPGIANTGTAFWVGWS